MKRLLLYARTAAALRPLQWLYLPLRRVQAHLPARVPRPRVQPAGAPLAAAVETIGIDAAEDAAARAASIVAGHFRFLGHTERLDDPDWTRRHVSHLWSYHLHYFDYARDLAWAHRTTGEEAFAARFGVLARSWIAGTTPGRGDGWEPYAVSLRIVNWIHALLVLGDALDAEDRRAIGDSLGVQAGWLERRLEKHIQANHLQKNYLALAVAGLFFEGRDARRWRRRGLAGCWRAAREQVLPDGVQYERSPMYHAVALADFLELAAFCRAAGERVPADVAERVASMARALGALSRPDGTLHLFNDAANGSAPSRAHLDRLARRLGMAGIPEAEGVFSLPHAGYFGFVAPEAGERLLVDCGTPGPRHQPAHVHCDLLSFELDLGGRPVVVDSGVSGYADDPLRAYVRSTRAHNTVTADGREQSEVWGIFRMARPATPLYASARAEGGGFRFEGGYATFDGYARHHRAIVRTAPEVWEVVDRVEAREGAHVVSRIHLHPDFDLAAAPRGFVARAGGVAVALEPFGTAEARVVRGRRDPAQGWYCPAFGERLPAPVLELTSGVPPGKPFGYRLRRVS